MKFEFTLKFGEYYFFCLSHGFRSVVTQTLYIFLSMTFAYTSTNDPLIAVILFAASYLILWLINASFSAIYLAVGKNKTILTPQKLTISDNGLESETQYGYGRVAWPGVIKVVKIMDSIAITSVRFNCELIGCKPVTAWVPAIFAVSAT
jgi:hypothetical protein